MRSAFFPGHSRGAGANTLEAQLWCWSFRVHEDHVVFFKPIERHRSVEHCYHLSPWEDMHVSGWSKSNQRGNLIRRTRQQQRKCVPANAVATQGTFYYYDLDPKRLHILQRTPTFSVQRLHHPMRHVHNSCCPWRAHR